MYRFTNKRNAFINSTVYNCTTYNERHGHTMNHLPRIPFNGTGHK